MSFRSLSCTSLVALVAVSSCAAFSSPTTFGVRPALTLYSSIGGGLGGGNRPPGDRRRRRRDGSDWDDFLDPNQDENEKMRRAKELQSEQNLPISFDPDKTDDDGENQVNSKINNNTKNNEEITNEAGGALAVPARAGNLLGAGTEEPTEEMLKNNPYMQVVSGLSPSDLISKFTTTAHPRVQDAVRRTILGLIGGLPKMAFETNTITTGQRLASLMFQLQMTGYMFKNAEWQLSLAQSLGMTPGSGEMPKRFSLPGSSSGEESNKKKKRIDPLKGKIKGKLKVSYGPKKAKELADDEDAPKGMEVEVDAAAYLSELRNEVSSLRTELSSKKKEKEEALRKDLLLYIRTLPEQNLRSLTDTISQDVLAAMKGLVNVVIAGIGDGEISAETVTEQSGEAMAQLCMWQLVVGYNLRELEYREEMKNSLMAQFGSGSSVAEDDRGPLREGGVDLSEPGVME